MLNKLELDSGVEDGKFGKQTNSALLKFQEKNDLSSTGEVDIQTWKKILNLMGVDFDKNNFIIYNPNGSTPGPGPIPPTDDLMARLKKWLKL
jgi:peptidoglycan hydrolase-like protein with peptidoglycan-binding domain